MKLLLFITFLLPFATISLPAADRVALVIGNNAYPELRESQQLTSPRADATDIAKQLRAIGFTVLEPVLDGTREKIIAAKARFLEQAKDAQIALFYFSGHGFQVGEENFLIPSDMPRITSYTVLKDNALLLRDSLMVGLEEAGAQTKVIVLDCCRDNPFAAQLEKALSGTNKSLRTKGGTGEISGYGAGFYLAFATSPGTTADDGNGQRNSPFTSALLTHLKDKAGENIRDLFDEVKETVREKSGEEQVPWTNDSLSKSHVKILAKLGAVVATVNKLTTTSQPKPANSGVAQTATEMPVSASPVQHSVEVTNGSSNTGSDLKTVPSEVSPMQADTSQTKSSGYNDTSGTLFLCAAWTGALWLLCGLAVSIKAFKQEGIGCGVVALFLPMIPLILGWVKVERWKIGKLMTIYSISILATLSFFISGGYVEFHSADLQNVLKQTNAVSANESSQQALGSDTTGSIPLHSSSRGFTSLPSAATLALPFRNTLDMQFVPVPGTKVLFCIHETRVRDYAAYAKERLEGDSSWRNPYHKSGANSTLPVSIGDDFPVVNVSWQDGIDFCRWLSAKEQRNYRLPTDNEWSFAVGIGEMENKNASPVSKSMSISGIYPWGTTWPPGYSAGNYYDKTAFYALWVDGAIKTLSDGYVATASVMSFKPNAFGLYDLGGNVSEWCEDKFNNSESERVLRGGSWFASGPHQLLSSYRQERSANSRYILEGFRCVLEISNGKISKR